MLDEHARRNSLETAQRLEEQARIFIKMGYDPSELTMVFRPWPIWDENIVPKSALGQHETREREEDE